MYTSSSKMSGHLSVFHSDLERTVNEVIYSRLGIIVTSNGIKSAQKSYFYLFIF